MDISRSWSFLEQLLSIQPDTPPKQIQWKPVQPSPELKEAALFLGTPGMYQLLDEWLHEILLQYLCKQVSPEFWRYFENSKNVTDNSESKAEAFSAAFGFLYDVYTKYFMVAVKRLHWLHLLAASAPRATPTASAFTLVKGGKTLNSANIIKIGEIDKSKMLSTSVGSIKAEKNSRAETGRLSVTFEKGTKGDEDMETSIGLDKSMPLFETACQSEGEKRTASIDGSYVQDYPRRDNSAFQHLVTSSIDSGHSDNISQNNPKLTSLVFEESDEFESFIRSPIGGNNKHTGFNIINQAKCSTSVSHVLLSGSSVSTVPGTSLTSTPGTAIKQTPGPLTPIAHEQDYLEVFSDIPMEDYSTYPDATTPSFHQNVSTVIAESSQSALPDASLVFGLSAAPRPIPGATIMWPSSEHNRIQLMIKASLFYTFPPHFAAVVKDFYSLALNIYQNETEDSVHDVEIQRNQTRFDEVNRKMDEMNLMELVSGAAVTEIVRDQIEKHIENEYKGNFETSYLSSLEEWLDQQVIGWLNRIYACKQTSSQIASVRAFRGRLRHFIYETYGKSLIGQFFDIIIDFPESKPAIVDLSSCLAKTDLRSELVSTLKHALENRLLHPGVNTADILTAYIAAIKSLRLLEPAGVILELVCEPVGRYLRSREDTVRCIVASLTDEGNNELISELVNTKPVGDENLEEDGNMCGWEDWIPDPVDADPSTLSRNRRSADILSTLVNIYGSKELFVNEYRALLADRILMQYHYDVERELRYLELLKLRFGEAQLHFCEVMLRDVTESRRINARIQDGKRHAQNTDEIFMNAMILSAQFWPTFRDEKIKLPQELQDQMDKYTKLFEAHKQNRTLAWKPHLGVMSIELELKDETLNFSVSPVHAAIIMKFQSKSKWSIDELSADLEMTASVLRRKISFWQGQGLLREASTDVYHLVEERRGRPHDLITVDDEEMESAMASAQQQKEEDMQVFWTYIQGMLANLNCLTLERIHSMLRMFAMEEPGSSEVTLQELKHFLDNKVKDQVLIFSAGVYRLNK